MEGSGEMNSGDDKARSDKKRTKIVKTPSQIEGLEKFYDEHKYPTEALKLQLAKDIGLTEKQVSSWFCHRRLKDKRFPNATMYANKRQDFSHRDDGTSSGGSSSKHNLYSKVDRVHMTASKLSPQSAVNYVNFGKPRSGPSGYLKVKRCVDNPAVTAVKKQLGGDYREDGPPLGIVFDPLPPGAFEPLPQHLDNSPDSSETYSAEDYVAQGIPEECISKPAKVNKFYLAKREIAENGETVQPKIPRKKEMQMVNDEYRQDAREV